MAERSSPLRQHPIPPPSHPRQFRAIGLLHGQYYPSEESSNRGILITDEGAIIEAVLLGKMVSLFKKHLDLAKPHLWIVYPRLRDEDNHLHCQLAGIWDPKTLGPGTSTLPPAMNVPLALPPAETQNGYFSIRGEVVFVIPEEQFILVKIRQAPKSEKECASFFKVRIQGVLDHPRPVGRFWSIEARLQEQTFILQCAEDLGFVIHPRSERQRSRRPFRPQDSRPPRASGDRPSVRPSPRPVRGEQRTPKARVPRPKPVKRETSP